MECFYELSKSPATHDFCNWLSRVEEDRITSGEESLQIRIVHGYRKFSRRDHFYSHERRDWRIQNLLMPLAWLVPSVTDVSMGQGEQKHSYLNPGCPKPPIFKAPKLAREIVAKAIPSNAVTISLRDSDFEPERNTDNPEWVKVARWLSSKGYTPVIVPDAEADMRGASDLPFFNYKAAAYCLPLKLALYEHCLNNLFICSGVQGMAMYSDVKLYSFKTYLPGIPCLQKEHMRKGGWSPEHKWDNKRVYWELDKADFIISEIEKHGLG